MNKISNGVCWLVTGAALVVSWGDLKQGAEPPEGHTITLTAFMPSTTVATSMGIIVSHDSAITEAVYFEPARTALLPLDGVTHPRRQSDR
jgi:hypothetical protein